MDQYVTEIFEIMRLPGERYEIIYKLLVKIYKEGEESGRLASAHKAREKVKNLLAKL